MKRLQGTRWFFMTLSAIAVFTALGPAEKTLGTNARLVYLHGAWVWASLAAFLTAGAAGLLGLTTRRETLHRWSRALGRTGLVFWITYLPISLCAMQTNWNGLFLAEPRWRLAVVFAVSGLLLQIGLALVERPGLASVANLVYLAALGLGLQTSQNVMHPPAPMLQSDAPRIQFYFAGLVVLTLLAACHVAHWWHQFEHTDARTSNYPSNSSPLR